MALVFANRVKVATSTTGTGTVTPRLCRIADGSEISKATRRYGRWRKLAGNRIVNGASICG